MHTLRLTVSLSVLIQSDPLQSSDVRFMAVRLHLTLSALSSKSPLALVMRDGMLSTVLDSLECRSHMIMTDETVTIAV